MTQEQPSLQRQKPSRYLVLAEWLCYLTIIFGFLLGPFIMLAIISPNASQLQAGLLLAGVLSLAVVGGVGLGIVMGRKHRPRL